MYFYHNLKKIQCNLHCSFNSHNICYKYLLITCFCLEIAPTWKSLNTDKTRRYSLVVHEQADGLSVTIITTTRTTYTTQTFLWISHPHPTNKKRSVMVIITNPLEKNNFFSPTQNFSLLQLNWGTLKLEWNDITFHYHQTNQFHIQQFLLFHYLTCKHPNHLPSCFLLNPIFVLLCIFLQTSIITSKGTSTLEREVGPYTTLNVSFNVNKKYLKK